MFTEILAKYIKCFKSRISESVGFFVATEFKIHFLRNWGYLKKKLMFTEILAKCIKCFKSRISEPVGFFAVTEFKIHFLRNWGYVKNLAVYRYTSERYYVF